MIFTSSKHEHSNGQTGCSECFDEETKVSTEFTLYDSPLGSACSLTKRNTNGEGAGCKGIEKSSSDDTT
jgi:hypothetical protein